MLLRGKWKFDQNIYEVCIHIPDVHQDEFQDPNHSSGIVDFPISVSTSLYLRVSLHGVHCCAG
jgi:hypothetical protein